MFSLDTARKAIASRTSACSILRAFTVQEVFHGVSSQGGLRRRIALCNKRSLPVVWGKTQHGLRWKVTEKKRRKRRRAGMRRKVTRVSRGDDCAVIYYTRETKAKLSSLGVKHEPRSLEAPRGAIAFLLGDNRCEFGYKRL